MKKHLRSLYFRTRAVFTDFRNRFRSTRRIFESIHSKGGWGDKESVSGSGSALRNTQKVIQAISTVVEKYSIQKILDIPCGDFNWMKEVNLKGVEYIGADIVNNIVVENARKYSSQHRSFFQADLTSDTLPAADLILCRDCLVHLSNHEVLKALKNIRNSGAKYLLTTTFPEHQNRDIITGNWRPVNLTAHPFNLPEPLELFTEGYSGAGSSDKALGLWSVNDIPH